MELIADEMRKGMVSAFISAHIPPEGNVIEDTSNILEPFRKAYGRGTLSFLGPQQACCASLAPLLSQASKAKQEDEWLGFAIPVP